MSNQQVTNSQNKEKPVAWWRACFPIGKRTTNGVRNPVSSRNNSSTHTGKHTNQHKPSTKVIDVDKVMGTRVVQDTRQVPIKQPVNKPTRSESYKSAVSSRQEQQRAPGLPRAANFDPYTYALNILKSIEIERKNEEYETPSPQEPTKHKAHTEDTHCHGRDSPVRHHHHTPSYSSYDNHHHHTPSSYDNHHTPSYSSYDNHHHHTSSNDYGGGGSSSYDNYGGGGSSSACDYGGSTD